MLRTQAATLGLAPSIMQTFTQPAQTLAAVGRAEDLRAQQPITEAMQRFAFEQAAPGEALDRYANIAAGTIIPGTQTTTAPGGQTGGLAGALGGAGLVSSLGIGAGSTLAGASPGLFGSAIGAVGPQVPGALSGLGLGGINPYILGGALLGGLFS